MPEEVYRQKLIRDSMARLPYLDKMHKDTAKKQNPPVIAFRDSAAKNTMPKNKSVLKNKSERQVNTKLNKLLQNKTPGRKKLQRLPEKNFEKEPLISKKDIAALDSTRKAKADSIFNAPLKPDLVQGATNLARQVKSQVMNANVNVDNYEKELAIFEIQWHKILANSFACIAMFLIGAPLGAIIKKGGLGVPFLVSIFFFIVYYVITMQGEKLAKQNTVSIAVGVWLADVILLIIGLVFLRQARIDARLFEADFYSVVMDKLKQWLTNKKLLRPKIA